MASYWFLIAVGGYFLALFVIARITSKGAGNADFFTGKHKSQWYLVAYGMIGTSLSGVTYMSVPGAVKTGHFYYLQIVFGYFLGYLLVAIVLLPLYYRLHLSSIYSYLGERFGRHSQLTGASFFLLSRTLGACARIYLVLDVLQVYMLDALGIPFAATAALILLMILLYTFQGGVKTIVWTDTLQTTFMLMALVVTLAAICSALGLSLSGLEQALAAKGFTKVFDSDWRSSTFFLKQLLSGVFITVAMTGLDQEMMQKNISCRSLGDAQKNMLVFSITNIFVNLTFLLLGGALWLFILQNHSAAPAKPDSLFADVALHGLAPSIGLVFIIGLVSALFPSADGAMTALTSSFCLDILALDKMGKSENEVARWRKTVHLGVAVLFLFCILLLKWQNTPSVITFILKVAGYTYGPLAALYAIGLFSTIEFREQLVPWVCMAAPALTYLLEWQVNGFAASHPGAYTMGFETAFVNVAFTAAGLALIRKRTSENTLSGK